MAQHLCEVLQQKGWNLLSITEDVSTVGVRDGNCMGDAFWLSNEEIVGDSISKLVFLVSSSTAVSSPTSSS